MPEDPLTLATFAKRQEVLIGLVADLCDMTAKLREDLQWVTTADPQPDRKR